MAKEIVIEFDEKGDPTVDLKGFRGKGCKAVAKAFADALGSTLSEADKPEVHYADACNQLANAK
jgi:hypothetical protein